MPSSELGWLDACQVLINRYRLAYFTNLTADFYGTPISAFWLTAKRWRKIISELFRQVLLPYRTFVL